MYNCRCWLWPRSLMRDFSAKPVHQASVDWRAVWHQPDIPGHDRIHHPLQGATARQAYVRLHHQPRCKLPHRRAPDGQAALPLQRNRLWSSLPVARRRTPNEVPMVAKVTLSKVTLSCSSATDASWSDHFSYVTNFTDLFSAVTSKPHVHLLHILHLRYIFVAFNKLPAVRSAAEMLKLHSNDSFYTAQGDFSYTIFSQNIFICALYYSHYGSYIYYTRALYIVYSYL